MRKIAIVNLRHNIKINDKTGEMKSPVFMLKLVNICKKLLTKNMRIFDTNFERLQCETRYHPDTHYMVEIEMLKTDNTLGKKGAYIRKFFDGR